jgi:hypothetical protein
MPLYEFRNEQGVVEEHYLEMKDAPGIGHSIVIDDRLLTQLPPRFGVSVEPDGRFIAWSQPLCDEKGRVPDGVTRAPDYDMNPKSASYRFPRFQSKSERKRYISDSDGRVNWD